MTHLLSRIRRPVRREGVERYLLVTLLSFGGSVALTRLFLELSGYPQLGGGELHIAHVLWGGLLLFLAALLPLIYANRWVYTLGGVLAGVGVGLFIDEVGKFITQSNDYFYPLAAPIIYAFFLLTVLLYFQVRRPISRGSRAELYRALDAMGEVLDHDLDLQERAALEARLEQVAADSRHPGYAQLARHLLEFLESDDLHIAPDIPGPLERALEVVRRAEKRWLSRGRFKAAMVGALTGLGILSLFQVGRLLMGASSFQRITEELQELVLAGRIGSRTGLTWLSGQLALEGSVGLILILGAVMLLLGRERRGMTCAYFGLLLKLTVVNVLVFYFEQFSTIIGATIQFVVLLGLLYYRRSHLGG